MTYRNIYLDMTENFEEELENKFIYGTFIKIKLVATNSHIHVKNRSSKMYSIKL